MSLHTKHTKDPLLAGYFTNSETSRLLRVRAPVIVGWLNGYSGTKAGPVLKRDFTGTHTISFLDLMELRFIRYFRTQEVPLQTIRKAAQKARKDWKVSHPLAMSKEKYLTNRRNIFAQIAEEDKDHVTYDLVSGQYELWKFLEDHIAKGVVFDPKAQAKSWIPMPEKYPNVIVDPCIAFGRSTIKGVKVPTSALFQQWKVEKNMGTVAEWFNVSVEDVETAINYELEPVT